MTRAEMNDAALPYFDKSSYDFGTITTSDHIKCTFRMENKGKADLVIHKIELNDQYLRVDINAPLVVKAGDTQSFTATVDKPHQGMDVLYIISIISNSPLRPTVNLFMTGDVKKK